MKRFKTVDDYISASGKWQDILILIREVLNNTDLTETVKWGGPVYTLDNRNVIGIGAFKNFVSVWFFQGVFLNDKKKKLVNAQEGVTKGLRQWRFRSIGDLRKEIITLKEYIDEAIINQIQGKEIKVKRKKTITIPPELKLVFDKNKELSERFNQLTMGKQREYAEYISSAKRIDTKDKRIDKIIPMILEGVGLNDKYRK